MTPVGAGGGVLGGVVGWPAGRGYAVAPRLPYWPDFVGRFRGFVLAIWAL